MIPTKKESVFPFNFADTGKLKNKKKMPTVYIMIGTVKRLKHNTMQMLTKHCL